jgi:hypothetical protein
MLDRRLVRRGRACLLWGLAAFVAVQLSLGLLIDQAWLDVRDPDHAVRLRDFQEVRAREPDAPLVVALGSSRMKHGLMADRLHPTVNGRLALVYNFGRTGGGPVMQLLTLRRLLADGVRPDGVFVEIMPGFFNRQPGRLLEEKDLDGALLRTDELVRAWRYGTNNWLLTGNWGLGRGLPCYRYAAELAQQLPFNQAPHAPGSFYRNGWLALRNSVTQEERRKYTAMTLNQYQTLLLNYRLAPQPIKAVHDLLALCRRNGIRACLVALPEGTEFRALYDPAAVPAIDSLMAELRRDYGTPAIDARQWIPDDDFMDSHHLLPSGAEVFTDRLGVELAAAWAESGAH